MDGHGMGNELNLTNKQRRRLNKKIDSPDTRKKIRTHTFYKYIQSQLKSHLSLY